GDPGDERERLREAVHDTVRDGEFLELAALGADGVGDAEQDAEHDEHDRDDPQRAEDRLDLLLEEQSQDDDRDAPDDDQPTHPGVGVVAGEPADQCKGPVLDDPHDVAPEEDDDGRLGADLGDRGEGGAWVLRRRQKGADDAQMRAGRDRKELGESLDQAEEKGFEQMHCAGFRSSEDVRGQVPSVRPEQVGQHLLPEDKRFYGNSFVHPVEHPREVQIRRQSKRGEAVSGDADRRESLVVGPRAKQVGDHRDTGVVATER
ncbi:hypothetical protein ABE10_02765, partial [Bacillus toyonensis]|nr:hypothetical protein [Bacillus toyonensis]